MLTGKILSRVFRIKTSKGTGTCFSVILKEKEFFITAAHVMDQTKAKEKIYFYANDAWVETEVKGLLESENDKIDVCCFTIPQKQKLYDCEIDLTPNIYLAQDCYILGFPDSWNTDGKAHQTLLVDGKQQIYPFPFVKKCIVSQIGIIKEDENEFSPTYFYLDTIINQGFSGGPVVMLDSRNSYEPRIVGVISAYKKEKALIYQHEGNGNLKEVQNMQVMVQAHMSIAYHLPLKQLESWDGN